VGAVCPQSVEEVEIVRIANTYKQPLWTVSTGKNMGYGMTAPATPGQVVLDLKRMNRILEVDADLGTCLLEPGVTYQQLKDYLEEHKIPLWIDVPTVGPIASPVGNTLDRGVGYTPYGEHFMFQCGMEVCCPTGGDAHRHGQHQGQHGVAGVQVGLRALSRRPVHPVELRHRHQDGPVADAPAAGLQALHGAPCRDGGRAEDHRGDAAAARVQPGRQLQPDDERSYQLAMFKRRNEIVPDGAPLDEASLKKAASANGLGMWNTYFALYGTDRPWRGWSRSSAPA
jgi:4-cresol dehydrogenase (hydroxylating)